MAQRILGLDLGAGAVKAVLLESTFRGWTVLDAAREPLGDGPSGPGRHAAAVRALLAARGWTPDAVVRMESVQQTMGQPQAAPGRLVHWREE